MSLRKGDVVVYNYGAAHESNGSLAVVVRVSANQHKRDLTVKWILVWGIAARLTPDGYDDSVFEKIGEVDVSQE